LYLLGLFDHPNSTDRERLSNPGGLRPGTPFSGAGKMAIDPLKRFPRKSKFFKIQPISTKPEQRK
jgi:hypothetical protein